MKSVIALTLTLVLTASAHAWTDYGSGTRNSGGGTYGYTFNSDGYKREQAARRQDSKDYSQRRSQQYGSGRRHSEGSRYQGLQQNW